MIAHSCGLSHAREFRREHVRIVENREPQRCAQHALSLPEAAARRSGEPDAAACTVGNLLGRAPAGSWSSRSNTQPGGSRARPAARPLRLIQKVRKPKEVAPAYPRSSMRQRRPVLRATPSVIHGRADRRSGAACRYAARRRSGPQSKIEERLALVTTASSIAGEPLDRMASLRRLKACSVPGTSG